MIDACSEPGALKRRPAGARAARGRALRARRARGPSARWRRGPRPAGCRARRGRASTTSTHANPLCPTASWQIGRLGDDGHVGAPLAHERFGAEAHVLLVDDGGHDEPAARPRSAPGRRRRQSSPPRRPSCPARRARRAGRPRSRGSNGSAMPSTPTVSMWPQNIIDGPGVGAVEHADRRSAGRARPPASRRRGPPPASLAGTTSATAASPGAPGTSDGFTELAATRSEGRGMGSDGTDAKIQQVG